MLIVDIQQVEMMKQPHSHSASIPSPQPKPECESECNITGCSDPHAAKCIVVPISVKPEPDLDPYFLSLEVPSRETEISRDDRKMKLDLLNLKLEIKSEPEEPISFDVAEMIVDPFKDCLVKPENEQVHNHDIPDHSEESLGAFSEESLLYPTPQAKDDHNISEVLVLNEPEGLNQEGRVCHLLSAESQVQKKQHSEKETCKGRKNKTSEAKTKKKSSTPQACLLCGNIYANCYSLKVHMRIHTGEKPYVCPTCGKAFPQAGGLKIHTRVHTGQKTEAEMQTFPCSVCGNIYANSCSLRVHKLKHTGVKPFICPTCGKAFFLSYKLKEHTRIHTGQKKPARKPAKMPAKMQKVPCSMCDKTFTSASGLRCHMRRHTQERPYACPLCEKCFFTIHDMNKHIQLHSNIKPFVCTECGNSFHRRCTLEKHQRIHTGERPYNCPDCGKALRYQHSLTMHMKTHRK